MNKLDFPSEFDGYRLLRPIGAGGMGQVFLGHDTLLDRAVAVKFISAADPDPEARERFLIEARAIARLQHPCVVAVYRAGEFEGRPYIVSEFVSGKSLDQVELPLPWRTVLSIADDLVRGLAVAHKAGVIHRDIKPANVILDPDGTAKLLDFGIARLMERDAESRGTAPDPLPAEPQHPLPPLPNVDADLDMPTVALSLPTQLNDEPTPGVLAMGRNRSGLTPGDRIVGTPGYMAPEVWTGAESTASSDIYSLGALLFSLSTGRPPHRADTIAELRHSVLSNVVPEVASLVPDYPHDLSALIHHCLQRNPADRDDSMEAVRQRLAVLLKPEQTVSTPEGNPYRGLRAFDVSHQSLFFGRDAEIRAVLDRIASDPVTIVSGDSGVGKSSLCRAGVIPRISAHLDSSMSWSTAIVTPGGHPIESICEALATETGVPSDSLAESLAQGSHTFARQLRKALGPGKGILLFIDQLEEIITQAERTQAEATARLLAWPRGPAPGIRILCSVRGDFLGRLASLPGLGNTLSNLLFFLRPLSPERIREAIAGPAKATQVNFENEDMVDTLVQSTTGSSGLPLLQFALERLWEMRDLKNRTITQRSLETLGGVAGALAMHADETIASLGESNREIARRLLLFLVASDGTRVRKLRRDLESYGPEFLTTLDALVNARLVVAIETLDGAAVEIAHEALITSWGTLVQWRSANVENRIVHERLARAAKEWERMDQPHEVLWWGQQLKDAEELEAGELAPVEKVFIKASQRFMKRNRRRTRFAMVAVVLVVVAVWLGVHMKTQMELDASVDVRMTAAQSLLSNALKTREELDKQEAAAFHLFDTKHPEEGESAWDKAQTLRHSLDETLARAGRELEAAVALDPKREDARRRFSELLFQRALTAEQAGREEAIQEFLGRMELYDVDGELSRAWNRPSFLSLTTDDPGATVQLFRTVKSSSGPFKSEEVDFPETGPWQRIQVKSGSYLLRLRRSDLTEVVLPVLVRRSEDIQVELSTAPAKDTPQGYVYVPPGRFLWGSAEEDTLRRGFHHTVPLHSASVDGYFIAKHETTFKDWLSYVESLPEDQHAKALPSLQAGGFEGALSLNSTKGGDWKLSYKPTSSTVFEVKSGEKVHYLGRKQHVEQDWLQFPVVGITAPMASQYAAWLNASGRVPGARLCTDKEWEFAARGADGREYPHGNAIRPEDANFDMTYDKVPTAMGPDEVGTHPTSRSPFGLDDTSGNVWEWTLSSVEPEGYAARGGSFYFDQNTARTHNRETPEPSFRDVSVGFRVCADLAPHAPSVRNVHANPAQ